MKIAIIPARGGSKRIPRKNIRNFCGKPMIAYAIQGALNCGLFDHIIVSTDDQEIADISLNLGAEIPFLRPVELASDFVSTVPVVAHGINFLLKNRLEISEVCCIYPSVPFIEVNDLKQSLENFLVSEADYCFPVTEFPSAIQRALFLSEDGRTKPTQPEYESIRTQDLLPAYYDVGQFYWGRVSSWLNNLRIHSNGVGFKIPSWRAVDIDTTEDWHRAEIMYRATKIHS